MNFIQTIKEAYSAMQHHATHVDGEKNMNKSATGNDGSVDYPTKTLTESPYHDQSMGYFQYPPELHHAAIERHRKSEKSLGGGHYHVDVGNGEHYFYHRTDDDYIDSFSKISDNKQEFVFKDQGVSGDVVTKNFGHALNHMEHISSDVIQSTGSRKFWENIHKKFPGKHIVATINDEKEKQIHTHDELMSNKNVFWNSTHGEKIRIKIYDK